MRFARLIPALLVAFLAVPAMAQTWIEFTDKAEMFTVNLPGQPKVETSKMVSEYGIEVPVKTYTATTPNGGKYMVMVVDYTGRDVQITDVRGSIAFAAHKLRMRGGQITFDAYAQIDRIEGHQIQMTNPDKSRTFWAAHLHARRLYILEATVPPDTPPPAGFQASLGILDAEGKPVRYNIDADGQRTKVNRGPGQGN
jgi:hypothetical protein